MTAIPPSGASPTGPKGPAHPASSPSAPGDEKYAQYLKSPFAKMFEQMGAKPTGKQMKMIIDNILKGIIDQVKKQETKMKEAMKRLGKQERGEPD